MDQPMYVAHQAKLQADANGLAAAKVQACACTNTWTREADNMGAHGVVTNTKTA